MMPLRLHVCTSPADRRVYHEHLKVTTNNALKITHKSIFWLKFSLFYPVKITDTHFKACVLCSQRMCLQFVYCYAPLFTVQQKEAYCSGTCR